MELELEPDIVRELAGRLNLTRPLAFLDLETTGLNTEQDRIIELAAVKLKPMGGETTAFYSRFNPGIPINPDATAKHGITDADVALEPPFRRQARGLAASLTDVDLVAFNGRRFDSRVLVAEFARAGVKWEPGLIVDPWAIWQRKEPRDLAGAIKRFAPDFQDDAGGHQAIGDTLGMIAALIGELNTFWPDAPGVDPRVFTVQELSDAGRDPNWIDPDGKIAWINGIPCFTFGAQVGVPVTDAPARYVDWMLKADFPAATKAIVRDLRNGTILQRSLLTE